MLGCPLRHYDFYSENQAAINKVSLKIYNKRKAAELNDKNVKEQMNQTSILQAAQDSQKKSHEQIGVGTFVTVSEKKHLGGVAQVMDIKETLSHTLYTVKYQVGNVTEHNITHSRITVLPGLYR